MKVKIKLQVNKDGSIKVNTIEGAGTACRAVADKLVKDGVVGAADEASRDTTQDYYVDGTTDNTVQNNT